jgi:hypothetical protein
VDFGRSVSVGKSMAAWWVILALGCNSEGTLSPFPGGPCEAVARGPLAVAPDGAFLHIGDTLTMRWSVAFPQCLDAKDTLVANRRWRVAQNAGVVAIDSLSGHVTGVRPGWTDIVLTSEALGSATLQVLEPLGADSVFTTIRNLLGDSATVVLKGANGTSLRSQTVAAGGWTCWVTPLSDSLGYSAVAYPQAGADSLGFGTWTNPLLTYEHVFIVTLYAAPGAAMNVGPVSPDPGGCAPPGPPQVYGGPDTLRYEAIYTIPVSDTAFYAYQNLGPTAGVTQSTTTTAGAATLIIRDSGGISVYTHDLTADGTFATGVGYGINWTIEIVLSDFVGTVQFSVLKS